jgi:dipeptidyl aminopeptidase/acylaminoacyl peptidase
VNTAPVREKPITAPATTTAPPISPFTAPTDPRLVEAFDKETAVFLKGAALSDVPIEAIEIPFEDTTLPAYFVTVDDSGEPRPTIVYTNGYDSTIQEMYFAHAPSAIRRGYNILLFDGPGQGRNLIKNGIHIRPDWENVVRPVVDYALTRPEIDPDKIALAGWSFGGFLAPRGRLRAPHCRPDRRSRAVG